MQAGGESQALRQWGAERDRRELRGSQWGEVAVEVAWVLALRAQHGRQ